MYSKAKGNEGSAGAATKQLSVRRAAEGKSDLRSSVCGRWRGEWLGKCHVSLGQGLVWEDWDAGTLAIYALERSKEGRRPHQLKLRL